MSFSLTRTRTSASARIRAKRLRRQGARGLRHVHKLTFEPLEDRAMLSGGGIFTVISPADDGSVGTLRWAIDQANSHPGEDTVQFDPSFANWGETIFLAQGQLSLTDAAETTIEGNRFGVISQSTYRAFYVAGGASATIIGLVIGHAGDSSVDGLGIYNSGTLTVRQSTIDGNRTSSSGGGIYNDHGTLTVNSCEFGPASGNFAAKGGGIYNDSGTVTITDTSFSTTPGSGAGNNAAESGGAIYNAGGSLTISRSTFSWNSASASGGAIFNADGEMTVSGSTLSENSASQSGGGIYNSATLTVSNCTLTGNSAPDGGGIYGSNFGAVVLHATIVAGNTATASAAADVAGTVDSASAYNLVGDGTGLSGISNGDGNQNQIGNSTSPIDPMLTQLGPYGGPTWTMALIPGSPALGSGKPDQGGTDQRGFARPATGQADIGAFQTQTDAFLVSTTSDLPAVGVSTLRDAISLANALPTADTITFDPALAWQTIQLNYHLTLTDSASTTIQWTGPGPLTLKGNGGNRVFYVDGGATAQLIGLTITGGGTPDSGPNGPLNALGFMYVLYGSEWEGGADSYQLYTGGGICNRGTLTVSDCTLYGNSAVLEGGGICNWGTLTVIRSTITGNTAFFLPEFHNSFTMWGHPSAGGGISNWGTLSVDQSTITGNIGGGLLTHYANDTPFSFLLGSYALPTLLHNTIIAGNTRLDLALLHPIDLFTSNDWAQNVYGPVDDASTYNLFDPSQNDAKLGTLGWYGGPSLTMPLLPGSPALNAGDPALAGSTDQRGYTRGNPPDIGAFEAVPTAQITSPAAGSSLGEVNLTLTADAPAVDDQAAGFTYTIDWGDGVVATIPPTANNGAGIGPISHIYQPGQVYQVAVTATDQGGGVGPANTGVVVVGAADDDSLAFSGGASAEEVQVTLAGAAQTFHSTGFVFAAGQGGGDTYTVNFGSTLTTLLILAGGGDASGDTLIVNGDNSPTNFITKTPDQVTWGDPVTETVLRDGIPNTVINAHGTSQNIINDPGGGTIINGGPGANTVTITATSGSGVVVNSGPSSNSYFIDLGSLEGPLTLNGTTGTSQVTVNAAENTDIVLTATQITSTTETVNLSTVNLNLGSTLAGLAIDPGAGANTVHVESTPAAPVTINATEGVNTYVIDMGSLAGAVAINDTTGASEVQVNAPPSVSGETNVLTLSATGVTTLAGETISLGATLPASLAVDLGAGDNTVHVESTPAAPVTINADEGSNTYVIDMGSLAGAVAINDSTGASEVQVNAPPSDLGQTTEVTLSATGVTTSGGETISLGSTTPAGISVQGSSEGEGTTQVIVEGTPPAPVTVQNAVLVTTLTVGAAWGTYGGTTSLTATLKTGDLGVPNQTVVFTIGGSVVVTASTDANGVAALSGVILAGLDAGLHLGGVAAAFASDDQHSAASGTGDLTVMPAPLTVTADAKSKTYGNGDPALTYQITSGSLVGSDDFSGALTRVAGESVGTYGIGQGSLTLSSNYDLTYSGADLTITTVAGSVFVLAPSVSGALTVSGNASLNVAGTLFVDSNSSSAISASGNAQVTASGGVLVVGGVSQRGNAVVTKTGTPGATVDPFSGLVAPAASGTAVSVNLNGNSTRTIDPGIYSQIKVAGNAQLTLNPGVYVIAGGGISVTGNASLTGSGVLLYNAGSNVLGSSGTPSYGGVTFSGNSALNLSAPTSGTYAGMLIFQARDNTRAMSISGNASTGITGTIYASAALLALGGNAQLRTQVSLAVDRLQVTGNGSSALTTDGVVAGSGVTAGELLAGDLFVYVDNANGSFRADTLARLDEAIAGLDALLAAYNVTITEVLDRSLANLVLNSGVSSAAGGYAEGVLGCFTNTGEITLIDGWDWYAGADPAAIGAGQFDFQTIVTHELGHALGLGHSEASTSVMHATLASGVSNRVLSSQDLNIADDGGGPGALRAVATQGISAYAAMPAVLSSQRPQANDAYGTLSAATPNAIRVMSEGLGLLGSSRGTLDGRAVREILEASDTLAEGPAALPPFTNGRDARRTPQDWAGNGYSHDKALDLVLDDFENAGLEDTLLELVAAGCGC